jgi:hypothetical protein
MAVVAETVEDIVLRLAQATGQGIDGAPMPLQELHGAGLVEFAQAVAEECAKVCEQRPLRSGMDEWDSAAADIRERFGLDR